MGACLWDPALQVGVQAQQAALGTPEPLPSPSTGRKQVIKWLIAALTRKAERLLLPRPGSYFKITAARNRSRGCGLGGSWRRLLQFCRINNPFLGCSPRGGGAASSPVPVSALLNIWKGVELTKLLQDSSLATISMSLVKHFKNINELT